MKKLLNEQESRIDKYYKFHSLIYDSTRWTFLFGRKRIIEMTSELSEKSKILEIGCGTGRNLKILADKYKNSEIIGVDLSAEMIKKAKVKLNDYENIKLINQPFSQNLFSDKFDIILFSYCLTMVNPGWEEFIELADGLLNANGKIAVVDFYKTDFKFYKKYMLMNHVEMEEKLLDKLKHKFTKVEIKTSKAYFGIWEYFCFIGNKKQFD